MAIDGIYICGCRCEEQEESRESAPDLAEVLRMS